MVPYSKQLMRISNILNTSPPPPPPSSEQLVTIKSEKMSLTCVLSSELGSCNTTDKSELYKGMQTAYSSTMSSAPAAATEAEATTAATETVSSAPLTNNNISSRSKINFNPSIPGHHQHRDEGVTNEDVLSTKPSGGGGRRLNGICGVIGCQKLSRGGSHLCVKHGGGRRCKFFEGGIPCNRTSQGRTNFCKRHGGGNSCVYDDCAKPARGGSNYCSKHLRIKYPKTASNQTAEQKRGVVCEQRGDSPHLSSSPPLLLVQPLFLPSSSSSTLSSSSSSNTASSSSSSSSSNSTSSSLNGVTLGKSPTTFPTFSYLSPQDVVHELQRNRSLVREPTVDPPMSCSSPPKKAVTEGVVSSLLKLAGDSYVRNVKSSTGISTSMI